MTVTPEKGMQFKTEINKGKNAERRKGVSAHIHSLRSQTVRGYIFILVAY